VTISDAPPRYLNRNVYILGAGFSAEGGLPVVRTFLNRMRDAWGWLRKEGRHREAEAIDRLFKFRLEAASAAERVHTDLENIEELFSLAAASAGESLAKDVTLAIAGTLDFAETNAPPLGRWVILAPPSWPAPQTLKPTVSQRSEYSAYELSGFDFFMLLLAAYPEDRAEERRDTFITFNYDLLVESALHNLGIPFTYGFHNESAIFSDSARCVRAQISDSDIPVLKLHGSVNWTAEDSSSKGLVVHGTYSDLVSRGMNPMLVPPTWRKTMDGEMLAVWDAAVAALRTATRIIIIGYSMPHTDQHFKYLLAAGLQNNISLRQILFVNDKASELRESLFKVLRDDLAPNLIRLCPLPAANFIAGNSSYDYSINRPLASRFRP
jgi:hypothetical protein